MKCVCFFKFWKGNTIYWFMQMINYRQILSTWKMFVKHSEKKHIWIVFEYNSKYVYLIWMEHQCLKNKICKRSNIILPKSCLYFLKYRKLSCVQTCWLNFARRNLKAALECLPDRENWFWNFRFTGRGKRGEFGTAWEKVNRAWLKSARNSRPVVLRPKVQKAC